MKSVRKEEEKQKLKKNVSFNVRKKLVAQKSKQFLNPHGIWPT
jgi:hypothetical protein